MPDVLTIFEMQGITWIVGVSLAIFATIVQNVSKKYKPWSWLAEQFGRAINKDMLDKVRVMQDKIDELEKADKRYKAERDMLLAIDARRRILCVADEIRKNVYHSEEYFDDALRDVSYYRNYCRTHPNFENSKAVISSKVIEETYKRCLLKDDFV